MSDLKTVIEGLDFCLEGLCDICSYKNSNAPGGCKDELMCDAMILLKAQELPTNTSITSAIECLTHPQDADDSDMAKAIDTAVRAMRLLKAQEPRVMTLADLRDIGSVWELNTPPYLWMDINPSYRWSRGFWVAWREIYDMIDGLHPTYDADNYGKIWRCWTSRPTEEQREAVKWG